VQQSVDGIVAVSHGTKTTASSNFKGLGKRDQTKPNQTICRSVAYFNLRPNPLGSKSPSLLCESALAPITFRFFHSPTSTLHRSLSAPFLHQVHPRHRQLPPPRCLCFTVAAMSWKGFSRGVVRVCSRQLALPHRAWLTTHPAGAPIDKAEIQLGMNRASKPRASLPPGSLTNAKSRVRIPRIQCT
jgi:hypothetical protein